MAKVRGICRYFIPLDAQMLGSEGRVGILQLRSSGRKELSIDR